MNRRNLFALFGASVLAPVLPKLPWAGDGIALTSMPHPTLSMANGGVGYGTYADLDEAALETVAMELSALGVGFKLTPTQVVLSDAGRASLERMAVEDFERMFPDALPER